ncbi:hypothetical protein MSG28_015995 [Choristoneura fumiferana]|uniref:Uncharacterized protein n=1 Tax=Choristoneura fumiferana TaxID=7141 RepID=A0ACC0K4Y5_CHOFU|nr:hypothetical protein MSG28_015995 [Choristoneura fumiferana]
MTLPISAKRITLAGYGYHDIDTCTSESDIIEFYNVTNSKEQAFKYIDAYTKGKGVKALSVNEKLVCERMLLIAGMFDKYLVALSKYNKNKQFPDSLGNVKKLLADVGYIIESFSITDYLSGYGYHDIDTCSSKSDIIEFYNVTNSKEQAFKYINEYTKGKGVKALSVNEKIVCERMLLIAGMLDIGRYALDEYLVALSKYNKNKQFPEIFANGLPDSLGNVKKLLADVGYITGRGVGGVINILIPGPKKHFLCYQDYLSKYGYNDIASCSSASEILEFYKVKNATQQAPKFINEYTKGKGVESLSEDYTKWTSQDLKEFTFSDLTDITPAVYDIINEVQPSSCNTASKIKDSIGSLTLVAAN